MAKREYIQANKDWLEAKAQEEDVKALPKGIYYKVLAEGNVQSTKPSVRSIVTAHYTGRTIDGKTFDIAVAVCRWLAGSVTLRWAMASFHSQASPVAQH